MTKNKKNAPIVLRSYDLQMVEKGSSYQLPHGLQFCVFFFVFPNDSQMDSQIQMMKNFQ